MKDFFDAHLRSAEELSARLGFIVRWLEQRLQRAEDRVGTLRVEQAKLEAILAANREKGE